MNSTLFATTSLKIHPSLSVENGSRWDLISLLVSLVWCCVLAVFATAVIRTKESPVEASTCWTCVQNLAFPLHKRKVFIFKFVCWDRSIGAHRLVEKSRPHFMTIVEIDFKWLNSSRAIDPNSFPPPAVSFSLALDIFQHHSDSAHPSTTLNNSLIIGSSFNLALLLLLLLLFVVRVAWHAVGFSRCWSVYLLLFLTRQARQSGRRELMNNTAAKSQQIRLGLATFASMASSRRTEFEIYDTARRVEEEVACCSCGRGGLHCISINY